MTRLVLKGLNCTNCANEIERLVNKLKLVEQGTYNFATKQLVIHYKDEKNTDTNAIIAEVKEIVKRLEPDVDVVELKKAHTHLHVKKKNSELECTSCSGCGHSHERGQSVFNKERVMVVIGVLIFALTLILNVKQLISVVLFGISYILIAHDILLIAAKNILKGRLFDENFLMAFASAIAFLMGEHEEAVAVILFYKIGEAFQDNQLDKARDSIQSLLEIKADVATLVEGTNLRKVNPEVVSVGEIVRVSAGEKVPLDGVVVEGESKVDTSALTGESLPVILGEADEILSGMLVIDSSVTVRVTKTYNNSEVAKILEMVQNAAANKAKTEKFITKFARVYTPVVVISAALLAIAPPLLFNQPFNEWVRRALIFLVASCPCALVISIPLGYFAGIGASSKSGVLMKGANHLEMLTQINQVVFDKTGTLTKGEFKVIDVKTTIDEKLAREYFVASEQYSTHPLAIALRKSLSVDVDASKLSNYQEVAGKGVMVEYKGNQLLAGNDKLMKEHHIKGFMNDGSVYTSIYFAANGQYIGRVLLGDEIKHQSRMLVKQLKQVGIKSVSMFTGDKKGIAQKIANELGLDFVQAELLPKDKLRQIEALKKQGKVAFVGDGINDAPVLVGSDIGFAMGALGSDAAVEAADAVIMNDDPLKVVKAISIAKKTRRIVIQNIVFALTVKALVLGLGAVGYANMWMAVFADVGVALIALLNAIRVNTEMD